MPNDVNNGSPPPPEQNPNPPAGEPESSPPAGDQGQTPDQEPSTPTEDQEQAPDQEPNPPAEDQGQTPDQEPNPPGEDQEQTPAQEPSPSAEDQAQTPAQEPNPPAEDQGQTPDQEPNPPAEDQEQTPDQEPNPPAEDQAQTPDQEPNPPAEDQEQTPDQEPNPPAEDQEQTPDQEPSPSAEDQGQAPAQETGTPAAQPEPPPAQASGTGSADQPPPAQASGTPQPSPPPAEDAAQGQQQETQTPAEDPNAAEDDPAQAADEETDSAQQEPAEAEDAAGTEEEAAQEEAGEADAGEDEEEDAAEDETEADAEPGDEKTWLYVKTPIDDSQRKFHLRELEGVEQISGLFHYRMILRSEDNAVDFGALLGKNVTVMMERYDSEHRIINAVVSRFIQAGYDGKITTYFAELSPWLWHLTLTSDSKIFQNQTVPEIIAAVFTDQGFTDYSDRTTGTYQPREFCVQYQETAFNFISRLMEEEGIFYFFEHTDGVHTLVLADDADAHIVCPGLATARLRHLMQERQAPDELIDRCNFEQQLIPNKYNIEDFNFETPDTDLLATVDGKETGQMKIYEFPGGFTSRSDGETIAGRRIESLELPQKLLKGESFCRAFIAGYKFTLQEHEREDMNGDYVIRSLSLWATQDHYRNAFDAFPSDMPYRPPRITPRPRVFGTQTAVVTGKSGEEIWTDQYGRIKVQFHWDRDGQLNENSSCWVRVAQVWAGKNWGTLFVPRIGTEVIVSFLEGDPNRPLVIGTVYNATQTVPYTLPDDKNKSTIKTRSVKQGSAGNEIRFDDTKDAEELYVHAQKDHKLTVENDRTVEVLNDDKLTVKNKRTVTVETGDDTLSVDTGKRKVTVTGDETHTNSANYKQDVTANYTLKVTGNITIEATGMVTIKGSLIKLN